MTEGTTLMKRLLIAALLLIPAVAGSKAANATPQAAVMSEAFGVYANLGRLVFEPDENAPERVQIWGAFSVHAGDSEYQLRERGYLYFRLPSGPGAATATQDWRTLKKHYENRPEGWEVAPGTHAFMKSGTVIRVRTRDEPPANPDTYIPGRTPLRVSDDYGVPLHERIMKPPHTLNYARVDEVLVTPPEDPAQILIRGAFSFARTDQSYSEGQVGYLYLSLRRPRVPGAEWPSDAPSEANVWMALAGRRQVVKFLRYAHQQFQIRVRPNSEPPAAPDYYAPLRLMPPFGVRPDTLYRPVRVLLDGP